MKRWHSLLSGFCALAVILAAFTAPAAYAAPLPAAPAQAATATPAPAATLAPTAATTDTVAATEAVTTTAEGAPALPALPPAIQDWERVKQAGKIVVGTAADYEPFEFYNSNFQLDGFDIALMKEIGKRMGVEVVFHDFAFGGLLDAVDLGQIDAAISAISVTPERRQKVDFSNLYYVGDDVVLAGNTFTGTVKAPTDLEGTNVGVERGTTYQAWAQLNLVDKAIISQEQLRVYDDTNQIVRDLRNGTIDVALMGALPARQFKQRFPDLRIAGEKLSAQEFAIAARNDSSLINQFNKALLSMQSDGTFAKLVDLYLQVKPADVTPTGGNATVDNNADKTPTPAATATATAAVTPTEAAAKPAATAIPTPPPPPPCVDGLGFIADLNYDDNNMTTPPVLSPGQPFVKSWRVQNTGTCSWQPEYALVYVNGNRAGANMGAQAQPIGRTVDPGEYLDISVSLTAPQEYGTYQGFWQMRNTAGQYFGQTMWVGITVPNPNPPPPPPPPPPSNQNPNLRADNTYINAGQCTTIRWDVDNVNAVYFVSSQGAAGVAGHGSQTVCPPVTTTYVLRVAQTNGQTVEYPITINVGGGAPPYTANFWADQNEIYLGDCTKLRWDVQGVQAVYLDGNGVVGVGSQKECPKSSTTYRLSIVLMDGSTQTLEQRIKVRGLTK